MEITTRPELTGTFGMVATSHWLASGVGMAILEGGGNAFDAVVAAAFTLQVVEPQQNGPGGDLPVIFSRAGDPTPAVLCGQGPAPAGATLDHFRALGLDLVPGAGPLAAAVPGATPALLTLLRDHGTRHLRDVLGPAADYARSGFPATANMVETVTSVAELFRDHWPTSAAVYLPGGRPPVPGGRFGNPALAATYERLLAEAEAAGPGRENEIDAALRAWSHGFVAEAVDAFAALPWRDSSGEPHAGVLTGEDMAGWEPSYEEPATLEFRGHTVCKPGPWSQGPVLLQQLALLADADLRPGTVGYAHTVIEGAKLAFADREAWYGDSAEVPLGELLAAPYTASRRQLIGETASTLLRPGSPGGRVPRLPGLGHGPGVAADGSTGEPTLAHGLRLPDAVTAPGAVGGDTVHAAVADRWGNLVAAMPSGGWLHSSPIIPELGFPLGTRLQMTWLQEGLASSLVPGRRPRTTLSPSLVLRDGEPVLAFGSPGGDQQDQWQLLFLLNHLVGGMNLQAAVDAPTFHSTHFPASFYPRDARPGQIVAETSLGEEVLRELERRGHEVVRAPAWSLSRMCAVGRDPATGFLRAAADPRGGHAYAAGR
ncbi:gamma-glutamyltransferase family protein [Rhizohabitans arisaemae]|uniref:gamma-glutamyltransferase family protein n=1 Tax=Rhizohabitans arisaemae TaxID=2720610 RepID=UPI0024B06713|nr:gamma-glutamyltransferase [Rhizohabitans arisaemae]